MQAEAQLAVVVVVMAAAVEVLVVVAVVQDAQQPGVQGELD